MTTKTASPKSDKDRWIFDTQMFQRIARGGDPADSYETLAADYDTHQQSRKARKEQRRLT